jgi:hypothetical protein
MNVKKNFGNRITGWLPKEPISPHHDAPSQMKANKAKAIFQNVVFGFLVIAGLFCSALLLSNSWIKIALISISLVTGAVWLLSRRILRSTLKFTLVALMIFAISLTAVESYLFWNGGYPTTYVSTEPQVTLSMQKMLNSSVEKLVQSIEDSQTFNLLRLEHGGNTAFESLKLWPSHGSGGYVSIDFASNVNNAYFHFYSGDGHQYIIDPMTYNGQVMSQLYPSEQTTDEALKQIDALGLNWFYNQALEIAQNRTTILPTVNYLNIELTFGQGVGNYQGIIIQLVGYHRTTLANGNLNDEGILISEFQPDGTLIYMSKPTME